jgi:hypothetical protein
MVTYLITTLILFGLLLIAVYFLRKSETDNRSELPEREPRPIGLFDDRYTNNLRASLAAEAEHKKSVILERAGNGDKNALRDALPGEPGFYDQVLDRLTHQARTDAELLGLVSFLTRNQLPVSTSLARAVFESWKTSPDRSTTAKTLHLTALANDASLYNDTVSTALKFWREGQLSDVSSTELRSLFEGEFWQLSNEVRSSGAGFVLKRTLASARRELNQTRLT